MHTPFISLLALAASFSLATAYKGEATFYHAAPGGLGACGELIDETKPIVALSKSHFTAANPNNDPICFTNVTVTRGGKSIVAEVVDKCESCEEATIDLSPAAFEKLAKLDSGRVQVTWKFDE